MATSRALAKEIFLDALDLAPAERGAFVRERVEGDEVLEARVVELLEAHVRADEVLQRSGSWMPGLPDALRADALDAGSFADDRCHPGQALGQFTLVEAIGEGGFGRVWLAEQVSPVRRQVALKVLKPGVTNEQVVRRFEAEQQALALMDHPGIARVIDGGSTESGQPWLAMELVRGAPITRYCAEQGLGVRARLELFIQVCHAVQHAHQKGIVHRDLKPSNVLVTTVEGQPVPKVIDFGIAKAVGSRLTARTLQTLDGQVMGTPAYMSPEQLEDSTDVDTRADVYSLGVLLYEMLSGTTPLEDATDESVGLLAMLDVIREVEPPRPSTRLKHAGGRARTDLTGVIRAREVQGDLDWIVLRCLEKDRADRYASVGMLSLEIERHLGGDPVSAGPPTFAYRASKFVRKHRRSLALAAALVLALVTALVVSLAQMRRARAAEAAQLREAERTRVELERSETIAVFLEHLLLGIDPAIAGGLDTQLLESLLASADESIAGDVSRSPEVEATLRRILGGSYHSLALFEQAEGQLRQALEIRARELGERHIETLRSQEELGGLYLKMGRLDEADTHLQAAVDGFTETEGAESEATMHALSSLATLRKTQQRNTEAVELFARIEPWFIEHKGERDPTTLLIMNNYAGLLETLGEIGEAVERFEMLAEAQLAVAGDDHPRTLMALNNLGSAYLGLGQYELARGPLEKALKVKRAILPDGHPGLIPTLGNLGYLYSQLEEFERALEVLDEAIEVSRAATDPFSLQTVQLQLTRATTLVDLEQYERAADDLLPVVDASLVHLPSGGFLRVLARTTRSRALLGAGQAEEAADEAMMAVEQVDVHAPVGHGVRGASRVALGRALMELEQFEQAREVLLEAHEQLRTSTAATQMESCISALVDIHLRMGLIDEAEEWRRSIAE